MNNEGHLILINNNIERAFLSDYTNEYDEYLEETFRLLE